MLHRPRFVGKGRRSFERRKGRRSSVGARMLGAALVTVMMVTVGVAGTPAVAEAVPRGEQVTFPGGVTISNFVMPNGTRAYCVEVSMGEPSGVISEAGRLSYLLGREGRFPAFMETSGIRQMNYLIDQHGQTHDAWTAAAVQLTIWRMRERFQPGNATLDRMIGVLQSSTRGQDLIQASDRLYAEARDAAVPPAKPRPVTGALGLTRVGGAESLEFRLTYPAGTTSVSVTGGTFDRNGAARLDVSGREGGNERVTASADAGELRASGSWVVRGARGWDALLDVYNTSTSSGGVGQRIVVATGSSTQSDLTGRFAEATHDVPPPLEPPTAASHALAAATVGGVMYDELIVTQQPGTRLRMWPEATAEFVAYLEPEAGAVKYDASWKPILGAAYEAQAEDPESGVPLWREWWADADGKPLRDAAGEPIPTTDAAGVPTAGVAANGTPYPQQEVTANGVPRTDAEGNPVLLQGRDAVMEQRQDPERWSAEELAALSTEQRCLAQPVFTSANIDVPGAGTVRSDETPVRSSGTIHWVERVSSSGKLVHEGECGVANETTKIDQPAIETQALSDAVLGDEIYDVAIVSVTLAEGAEYSVQFDAYRAPEAESGEWAAEATCTAANIVFRSAAVPVTDVGEVRSPSVVATPELGTRIWWVETLRLETPDGPEVLHRGACGLENETTNVGMPVVETVAVETSPAGAVITDTAIVSGGIAENAGARWEMTFAGYRASSGSAESSDDDADRSGGSAAVCTAENLLFETDPVPVSGPGEVRSPEVIAEPEWAGAIWWVETLWVIQGDTRTALHTGECGLDTETTVVTKPEVTTHANAVVAMGDRISDTATVTGELAARDGAEHQIVFRGYRGEASLTGTPAAVCTDENLLFTTDAVAVTETGDVQSPEITALPDFGDTVWWVEELSQRDEHGERVLHTGECGLPGETSTVQTPLVRTESAGSVEVGQPMFDTAIVTGAFPEREDVAFRVRFTAFQRSSNGDLSCAPGTEIPDLSDPEGVAVTGPGRFASHSVETRQAHLGLGGFVETLVMVVDGREYVVARGECGASDENFEVRLPGAPSTELLAQTGEARGPLLWWIAGGGIAVVGAALLVIRVVRHRREPLVHECPDLSEGGFMPTRD